MELYRLHIVKSPWLSWWPQRSTSLSNSRDLIAFLKCDNTAATVTPLSRWLAPWQLWPLHQPLDMHFYICFHQSIQELIQLHHAQLTASLFFSHKRHVSIQISSLLISQSCTHNRHNNVCVTASVPPVHLFCTTSKLQFLWEELPLACQKRGWRQAKALLNGRNLSGNNLLLYFYSLRYFRMMYYLWVKSAEILSLSGFNT